MAADNREPSRGVVETTDLENRTSNFPTHEPSKLRPGVTPPNVVGKATISNASAQTQTGAYRIPFGTLPVRRGGTHTGRRIVTRLANYGKGLKFSDDSPLGSA